MLRRATLMLTLAAIAVLVVVPAAQSMTVTCQPGKVCKGSDGPDWIFGSPGNDNIRPMGGNDYVFGNGGDDAVAHSGGADRISGGCGSDTLRGGFGDDRIYANIPDNWYTEGDIWYTEGNITCPNITAVLPENQKTALDLTERDGVRDKADGVRGARDLVDCAWLASRGNTGIDEGFGSVEEGNIPDDVVVDCSNRDDQ